MFDFLKLDNPKIFELHQTQPRTAFRSAGIHVILDVWDLRKGQDQFIEQMVNDSEKSKVLLIFNK
ncbi:MAG: hypothetical protein ACI9XO_001997 [Paraglaciecola sp.]|jgi:hypothetical protein